MSTETIDLKTKLVVDFQARESIMNGEASSAFHQKKRAAIARFDTLGFPTIKNEEWKYSNVKELINGTYEFGAKSTLTSDDLSNLNIPDQNANILYFVNGHYHPELSQIISSSKTITIDSLQSAYKENPELVNQYFDGFNDTDNAFTALNTAFALDGVFIHVPDNQVVEHPVILRFISDSRTENVGSQPRNIVAIGKNAQVKMAEAFRTIGEFRSFTNVVTEVYVGQEANVKKQDGKQRRRK